MVTCMCILIVESTHRSDSLASGRIATTGFLINLALRCSARENAAPDCTRVVIGQRYWAGSPTARPWKLVWGTGSGLYFGAAGIRSKDGEHDMDSNEHSTWFFMC